MASQRLHSFRVNSEHRLKSRGPVWRTMKPSIHVLSAALLFAGCRLQGALPTGSPTANPDQRPQPLAVDPQPPGLKRCESAPFDYPALSNRPSPAHVKLASVPLDPQFAAMGAALKTFRSGELIFHVSPEMPRATVDCVVAAADDAVAFVTHAMALPDTVDDGPRRDVFLLSPDTAEDVLEHLDPGHRFGVDAHTGRTFVGVSVRYPTVRGIFQWKRLPVSYLELGFLYAHEWVHMIQTHLRGDRPKEVDVVVEGEANLLGALFQDDVVAGAASIFFDADARRLARVRVEHPELALQDLLTQRPHEYHDEISFFAYIARSVAPAALTRVRLLARREKLDYATAWKRMVGRDLIEDGLGAILQSPSVTPRPLIHVKAPTLTIDRNEDKLWFVAPGLRAGERVTRSVRVPGADHADSIEMQADARGVVAWTWRLREGARYIPLDVEVRGESGACSGRYYDRGL